MREIAAWKHMADRWLEKPGEDTRGSRPRCVLLTDGPKEHVAKRLTCLVNFPRVRVESTDKWMPYGKPARRKGEGRVCKRCDSVREARLEKSCLLEEDTRERLRKWWFPFPGRRGNTPNWDIASTCKIDGRKGLLLFEAKAHSGELKNGGKKPPAEPSVDACRNHRRIGRCICAASAALAKETGHRWSLSRDRRYQMSNRFAWGYKLAELGCPVVLVYLGFLEAEEMRKPFEDEAEWRSCVREHSRHLFSDDIWNRQWNVRGQAFIPLIRTYNQPFSRDC